MTFANRFQSDADWHGESLTTNDAKDREVDPSDGDEEGLPDVEWLGQAIQAHMQDQYAKYEGHQCSEACADDICYRYGEEAGHR